MDRHPSCAPSLHEISAQKHLASYRSGLIYFKTRQLVRQPILSPPKIIIPKSLVFSTYMNIYSREYSNSLADLYAILLVYF